MGRHTPHWGTVPATFSDYCLSLGLTNMLVEVQGSVQKTS